MTFMKQIKKIPLALTLLFLLLFFVPMAYTQMSGKCAEVVKNMKVPFLDLKIYSQEKDLLISSVERVFDHGRLVMGPEIEELEQKLASYCSRKYVVSVGSGTDALFLGLKALDIGPGDEVITTSLSWIATANAIALTGAKPVFADINNDLNIIRKYL